MNKTTRIELRRVFLLPNLPEPLTRASYHLQIFDNYIENTRLRLRSVRVPETKEWTWILQQIESFADLSKREIAEIFLNETEHAAFEIFEGREVRRNERIETNEIRKNRYFYGISDKEIEIDLFLGGLWGLITAQIYFETAEEMKSFAAPPFAVAEVTANEFYIGKNLLGKTFADVRKEFEATELLN
jgi:CYTH domain-containing protein